MPTATREDYENIVARLQGVGPLVDQTIALMERGIAAGLTPPRIAMRDVSGQVAAQIVADPMQSPLLEAFSKWPADDSRGRPRRLDGARDGRVRAAARPAFEKLHDFLVDAVPARVPPDDGADALPDGAALYAYNVRWHTTTSLTPQQIHEIGLAEVKRIRAEMDKVIAAAGFHGLV